VVGFVATVLPQWSTALSIAFVLKPLSATQPKEAYSSWLNVPALVVIVTSLWSFSIWLRWIAHHFGRKCLFGLLFDQ